MAASKGNRFWEMRSKHGRDTIFADAQTLWNEACKYFQYVDENPWYKIEQLKKPIYDEDGNATLTVEIPTARPYTLKGLCLFLGVGEAYFRQFEDEKKEDFSTVIARIRDVIYTNKFEGATVGAFNANIISRDLGLIDKTETTGTQSVTVTMSKEEAKDISDALDKDF